MTSASYDVKLVIYDLSKGNRKSLTDRLLGIANLGMDIIPHTGIVVYGREYFYRRTVCNDDPAEFQKKTGLKPIQTLPLGTTKVPRYKFEKWCAKVQTIKYSEDCYDLVSLNSNHFCQDAAIHGLKLSRGVPEWVFKVPLHFPLSFSFGQFLRPILQSQHNSCLVQACRDEGLLEGEEIKNMGSFVAFIAGRTGIPISDSNDDDSSGSGSTLSTTDNETATQMSPPQEKDNKDKKMRSREGRPGSKISDDNKSDGRTPSDAKKQSGKQNRDGPDEKHNTKRDQFKANDQKQIPSNDNDSKGTIHESKPKDDATSEQSTRQEMKPLKSNSSMKTSSSNRSGATRRSNTKEGYKDDGDQNDSIEAKINTSQNDNLVEMDEFYTEGRTCTPLLLGREKLRRSKSKDSREIRRRGSLSSIRRTLSNALNGQGKGPHSSSDGNNSCSSQVDTECERDNERIPDLKEKDDPKERIDSSSQQSSSKAKVFSPPQEQDVHTKNKETETAPNGTFKDSTASKSHQSIEDTNDISSLQKNNTDAGGKKSGRNTPSKIVANETDNQSRQSGVKSSESNEKQPVSLDLAVDKKKLVVVSGGKKNDSASDKEKSSGTSDRIPELIPTERTIENVKETKSDEKKGLINDESSSKKVKDTNRCNSPKKKNDIDTVNPSAKNDKNEVDTSKDNKYNDKVDITTDAIHDMMNKSTQEKSSKQSADPIIRAVDSTVTDNPTNAKDVAAMNLLNPSTKRSYRKTKKQSNGDDNSPCMDSFYKPLVSSDTSSVATCVRRLSSILNKIHFDDDKKRDEKKRKYSLMVLQKVQSEIDTGKPLSSRLTEGLCGFLLHCLENKKSTVHALLLLRVVTLQAPPSVTKPCFCWLTQALIQSWENDQQQQHQQNVGDQDEHGTGHILQQPVARSLAWLVACNANTNFTTQADYRRLVYAATVDMNVSVPSIQLRQAACAFLYNAVLYRRNCCKVPTGSLDADELSPTFAIIGRACVDGLTEETDNTSRLRRIMILCRILRPRNRLTGKFWLHDNARKLLLILGLEDRIVTVQKQLENCSDEESFLCRNAIEEMLQRIKET